MGSGDNPELIDMGKTEVCYRRVAIAFLDIVGFSALMGADERKTFDRWSHLKRSFIVPMIETHHGHYVKSTGDGLLVTFPSATDAVSWAIDVQRGARTHGEGLRMRISLNFGEVIVDEEDDIIGDCVNIAARLEQHALPGGIIITQELREELRNADEMDLAAVRPLKLKNIQRRISAFHIHIDARRFAQAAAFEPAVRLPSVAVLPFDSDEAEQFFCDGVVDDLIASLSGVQEINVISHSTVKALGAKRRTDPRDLGVALAVDYIVCGALQRSPSRMRISFELIDASTGTVVAAERLAFEIDDLFAIQDRMIEKIVARVAPEVRRATLVRALRKAPENFTAYEHLLRALDKVASLDQEEFEKARKHLEDAIVEDPGFANPYAWLARWRTIRVGQGWSPDPVADIKAAEEEAQHAIRLDRRNALALATYGHVRAFTVGDYDTAIDYLNRAVAAGPNNAIARILRSGTLSFLGRAAEAQVEAQTALRLSPFDEQLFQFYGFMALACYVGDQFAEAVRWAQRSLAENPNYTHSLKVLVVAQAAAGKLDAARDAAERLLVKEPSFRLSRYRTGRAPFKDPSRVEKLIERFEAVGLPM